MSPHRPPERSLVEGWSPPPAPPVVIALDEASRPEHASELEVILRSTIAWREGDVLIDVREATAMHPDVADVLARARRALEHEGRALLLRSAGQVGTVLDLTSIGRVIDLRQVPAG